MGNFTHNKCVIVGKQFSMAVWHLYILWAEALAALFWTIFLRIYCPALEDKVSSSGRRADLFTVQYNNASLWDTGQAGLLDTSFGFPQFRDPPLWFRPTACTASSPGHCPVGTGAPEDPWEPEVHPLAEPRVVKSFASLLGVLCLLPAPMKRQQVTTVSLQVGQTLHSSG